MSVGLMFNTLAVSAGRRSGQGSSALCSQTYLDWHHLPKQGCWKVCLSPFRTEWEEPVPADRLQMKSNGKVGLESFAGEQEDTEPRLWVGTAWVILSAR